MLVAEKVRLTNRITASLKAYFPQVLDWFEDKDTQVFCEFIERFPDVHAAQAATSEQLTLFFQVHLVVRRTAIAQSPSPLNLCHATQSHWDVYDSGDRPHHSTSLYSISATQK
jgi:hypothetical protein